MVGNPFGSNSLDKKVAVINWKTAKMTVKLADLGEKFSIKALNTTNDFKPEISGNNFEIRPGTYLLKADNADFDRKDSTSLKNIGLAEFTAPKTNVDQTYVVYDPVKIISAEAKFSIAAEIVSNEKIKNVEVYLQNGNTYDKVDLELENGYTFKGNVPQKLMLPGFLKYRIIVHTQANTYTFPENVKSSPSDWDFHSEQQYVVTILPKSAPIYLFNAATDSDYLVMDWQKENKLMPMETPDEAEYQFHIKNLVNPDVLMKNGDSIYDYSFRYHFGKKILGEKQAFLGTKSLILKARSLSGKPEKLQVALLFKNGSAYGKTIVIPLSL